MDSGSVTCSCGATVSRCDNCTIGLSGLGIPTLELEELDGDGEGRCRVYVSLSSNGGKSTVSPVAAAQSFHCVDGASTGDAAVTAAGFCRIGAAGLVSLVPGAVFAGQQQVNSLRTHARQMGVVSSHFFLRWRQVRQPVRTRKMRRGR
jgi:hypothetical protein